MKENKLEEMRTLIEELHAASSAYYNKYMQTYSSI